MSDLKSLKTKIFSDEEIFHKTQIFSNPNSIFDTTFFWAKHLNFCLNPKFFFVPNLLLNLKLFNPKITLGPKLFTHKKSVVAKIFRPTIFLDLKSFSYSDPQLFLT